MLHILENSVTSFHVLLNVYNVTNTTWPRGSLDHDLSSWPMLRFLVILPNLEKIRKNSKMIPWKL